MKLANSPTAKNERRIGALSRLEYRLKDETLPEPNEERINKEMKVLSTRIIDPASARASRSKKYRGTR